MNYADLKKKQVTAASRDFRVLAVAMNEPSPLLESLPDEAELKTCAKVQEVVSALVDMLQGSIQHAKISAGCKVNGESKGFTITMGDENNGQKGSYAHIYCRFRTEG